MYAILQTIDLRAQSYKFKIFQHLLVEISAEFRQAGQKVPPCINGPLISTHLRKASVMSPEWVGHVSFGVLQRVYIAIFVDTDGLWSMPILAYA